jgi:hypothetical protein
MLTMKIYASVGGRETGSIWIVSAPAALGAADRAVLLVHPVRHRDEHPRPPRRRRPQLDVVRLRDGQEVELVDLYQGPDVTAALDWVRGMTRGRGISATHGC